MLLFVILFNLILTLFNFYLVWQLGKLTCFLKKVTQQLTYVEQQIQQIFSSAPVVILPVKMRTNLWRTNCQKWISQVDKLQQSLSLIQLVFRFWQRQKRYYKI